MQETTLDIRFSKELIKESHKEDIQVAIERTYDRLLVETNKHTDSDHFFIIAYYFWFERSSYRHNPLRPSLDRLVSKVTWKPIEDSPQQGSVIESYKGRLEANNIYENPILWNRDIHIVCQLTPLPFSRLDLFNAL